METIPPQAKNVLDYILFAGQSGNHLLFDLPLIRRTFARATRGRYEERAKQRAKVERALYYLAELPSIDEQRRFITVLPPEMQEMICYYYFDLLEQATKLTGPERLH
ncbi:MAG: hypothetical protein HUU55_20995 [Myxococcales bacterium]|nr:hypothetical protein [Myxococcales bacterium]